MSKDLNQSAYEHEETQKQEISRRSKAPELCVESSVTSVPLPLVDQRLLYEEARRYLRGLQLKSRGDYRTLHRMGLLRSPGALPEGKETEEGEGLPLNPVVFYGAFWVSWGDFLGPSYSAGYHPTRLPSFAEAKAIAQSLGVKNSKDYARLFAEGRLPKDMPRRPSDAYSKARTGRAWRGWPDFCGDNYREVERVRPSLSHMSILPYELAKSLVQGCGITSPGEYRAVAQAGLLPRGLPRNPLGSYSSLRHSRSWRGWGDFLGGASGRDMGQGAPPSRTGPGMLAKFLTELRHQKALGAAGRRESSPAMGVAPRMASAALPYEQSRALLAPLKLSGRLEFLKRAKENALPHGVPKSPVIVYSKDVHGCAWRGWDDFLSLGGEERWLPQEDQEDTVNSSSTEEKPNTGNHGCQGSQGFPNQDEPASLPLGKAETVSGALEQGKKKSPVKTSSRPTKVKALSKEENNSTSKGGYQKIPYLPYKEAAELVAKLGVKNPFSYRALVDSKLTEEMYKGAFRLPLSPQIVYRTQGWPGWALFLKTLARYGSD